MSEPTAYELELHLEQQKIDEDWLKSNQAEDQSDDDIQSRPDKNDCQEEHQKWKRQRKSKGEDRSYRLTKASYKRGVIH